MRSAEAELEEDALQALRCGDADEAIAKEAPSYLLSMEDGLPVTFQRVEQACGFPAKGAALLRGVFPPSSVRGQAYSTDPARLMAVGYNSVHPFDLFRSCGGQLLSQAMESNFGRARAKKNARRARVSAWLRDPVLEECFRG